jgi:CubicO group peptidase (beta-lactamase class C family)
MRLRTAWSPVILTFLAALAGAGIARAEPSDRIDAIVRAEMTRQRIPGVAVAIVQKGKVLKSQGYGYANVEHAVPVTSETMFQSGSVGKQFTAALVMMLVEDGRIRLDASVRDYLPDAPESWQPITIRHLLTHTSGIPNYTDGAIDCRRDYSEGQLAQVAYGLSLEFAPGSRWSYSNTGYLLLGIVIHEAGGQFYGDLLRERVFRPLGMKTARVISEADIVPHRAAGYQLVSGELKNQDWVAPTINTTADGALYLSLEDYIAWDRGLRAGALLRPESWAKVYEAVRLNSGNTYPYGFGWDVEEVAGQKVYRHGGAWQGFETHIARFLGDDLTIIVLANLDDAEPGIIVDAIAATFNPALARPAVKPIRDTEPEVTARLVTLLGRVGLGSLGPAEFSYVPNGYFPGVMDRYRTLMQDRAAPKDVELLERTQLGDDRVYHYLVKYPGDTRFDVTLSLRRTTGFRVSTSASCDRRGASRPGAS